MFTDARRGDIWMASVPMADPASNVIRGYRPVLVISSNRTNMAGALVTVAPMTSKIHHADGLLRVHLLPDLRNCLERPSIVLADQIMTLERRALGAWIGRAGDEDMTRVETAVRAALALQ